MSLIKYWNDHEKYWFNATEKDDKYLGAIFSQAILKIDCLHPTDRVIIYDQLARHYYRGEVANHIKLYFSYKACKVSNTIEKDQLPNMVWMWMVMPYRHMGYQEVITVIIYHCWNRIQNSTNDNESSILKRFLKSTYKCLDHMHNLTKYEGFTFTTKPIICIRKYKHILEHTDIAQPIISSTYDTLFKGFSEFIQFHKCNNILLMLSGGVDSMVCLHVLQQIPNIKFEVLHINYNNRGEDSYDEEMFLRDWCQYNSIDITVKRFEEIQRERCMKFGLRTFYEEYTRNTKMTILNDLKECSVILGHNKDDTVENILTNISKKQKFDDLLGMQHINSNTFRPLLNISKQKIFEYAHAYKIPYFKNTTPIWSQRGKIRSQVIPVINEWNPTFSNSLEYLAEYLKDIHSVKTQFVKSIINQYYNHHTRQLKIDINTTYPICIWTEIFHTLNVKISHLSLRHFINKLHTSTASKLRVNLTKNIYVNIERSHLYIFINFNYEYQTTT